MTAITRFTPQQHTTLLKAAATALVVAVVGMGAGRVHAQPQPSATTPAMQPGAHHAAHHPMAPGMGMAGPMFPERALDAVGASADQKTKLRDIFKAAGDDLRAQHDSGRALHEQMMALMAAPKVDPVAAEALRQKQLALHDTTSKRMLQAMLDAQAVLTPEQRAKLADRMAERHKQMEQHHQRPGHRMPDAPKG